MFYYLRYGNVNNVVSTCYCCHWRCYCRTDVLSGCWRVKKMKTNEETQKIINDYSKLYVSSRSLLLVIAYKYVQDYNVIEDIVQECWLHVIKQPKRILSLPQDMRVAYLVTCVKHCCIDYLREKKKVSSLIEKCMNNETIEDQSENMLGDDVKKMIQNLPSQERRVVNMMLSGYKTNEIALQLNITQSTVRGYWHKACNKLRIDMGSEE